MAKRKRTIAAKANGATLGIENELWQAADKLRGHLDAAEYKSVVFQKKLYSACRASFW